MSLDVLVDMAIWGGIAQSTEVIFTTLNNVRKKRESFETLKGHSYPIMFAFGAIVPFSEHHLLPPIEDLARYVSEYIPFAKEKTTELVARFGAYATGISAIEYVCGKLGIAPWKEVYQDISEDIEEMNYSNGFFARAYKAIKNKVPKKIRENIPLTIDNGSVLVPMIPIWGAVGVGIKYLHAAIHNLSKF